MATLDDHRGAYRARRAVLSAVSIVVVSSLGLHTAYALPHNPSDTEIQQSEQAVATHTADVSRLATTIADSQSAIAALEQEMGGLREAVNKALVDLHDAQSKAEVARQNTRAAREELSRSQEEIEKAQEALNEVSRTVYREGIQSTAVSAAAGADNQADRLDRATYLRLKMEEQHKAVIDLDIKRTQAANKESTLRVVAADAEAKERAAQDAEAQARAAIETNSAKIAAANERRNQLVREQAQAQARLDEARHASADLKQQREDFLKAEAEAKAREEAAREAERKRQEAEAQREAARKAAEEAARKAATAAAQEAADRAAKQERAKKLKEEAEKAAEEAKNTALTAEEATAAKERAQHKAEEAAAAIVDAANPDHTSLDNPYPSDENAENAATAAVNSNDDAYVTLDESTSTLNDVTDSATAVVSGSRTDKIEAVISRAEAQIGMPYAWGGGNAQGPTKGIRDGGVADSYGDYNKIGFDCSGLVLYAFAGVGISLPHYTGYQYQRGKKINPKDMQRGDLIFYGPNAEYHVAIYLGNGMMLEAPQSGDVVKKSPVRWSGMSPYAVRLI